MEPDLPLAERLPDELTLRRATAEDRGLLLRVYAATRAAELAATDWSDDVKVAFVAQQFDAQDRWYRESSYPDADYLVILRRGEPVGRLYVNRGAKELRIIDIALLPEFQRTGIGSTILRSLQAECTEAGQDLTIHVERFNPALHLYERLGFTLTEDKGVYLFMTWSPR